MTISEQIQQRSKGKQYQLLTDVLGVGKGHAKTSRELAFLTGVSRRDVTKYTSAARRDGLPICSGNRGFWFPADYDEWARFLRREGSRTKSQNRQMKALRLTSERLKIGEIGLTEEEFEKGYPPEQMDVWEETDD